MVSAVMASDTWRHAAACEIPNPCPRRVTLGRSRNHTITEIACLQQVNDRVFFPVPRARDFVKFLCAVVGWPTMFLEH